MAKLTLSVEPEIVTQAKKLARDNNTSVSAMFSRFVSNMARQQKPKTKIGPLTRKATGIISLDSSDYKEMLADAILNKNR